MKELEVVAGIDIGGTTTKLGLVNEHGEILLKKRLKTDSGQSYQSFFQHVCDELEAMKLSLHDQYLVEIISVGVGAPNGNCYTGIIDNAANLQWKGKVPVTEVIEQYLNISSFLANDANSAAIGEMKFGLAKGMKNFAAITLGTGLGCGLVVNGELVIGHNGHAAEIGHSNVYPDGRPCKCGLNGCFETYVSGPGLLKTAHKLLNKHAIESTMRDKAADGTLSPIDVTTAARAGDALALEAYHITGEILGYKLADLVSYIDPEAIILMGGLAKAGTLLLNPTKKYFEKNLLHVYRDNVTLAISNLNNDDAGILGAAAVGWNGLQQKVGSELSK